MAKRLRARTYIVYPDADSRAVVLEAGGLSKLTPEARAGVTMREVNAGDFCDDLPESKVQEFLERGFIEEVSGVAREREPIVPLVRGVVEPAEPPPAKKPAKKKAAKKKATKKTRKRGS